MRIGAAMALLAALTLTGEGCNRSDVFRQFEYEEEIFLSLDGSATIYVNASVAALDALRGAAFDTSPGARIDRNDVRAWFTSPVAGVTRTPSFSRRSGRRFVHARLEIDDIAQLSRAAPFAWSSYRFGKDGDMYVYLQTVGEAVAKDVGEVGWTGRERVAFRLHLPSAIVYHNALPENHKRGNILIWEQALSDRLRGEPMAFEARIESRSILSSTLWLFGATLVAVLMTFGLIIWWVLHRGTRGSRP